MLQLAKYSFANAKIRAMLSYLLPPETFLSLLDSKDVYELMDGLKKTPYKGIIEKSSQENPDIKYLEKELLKEDIAAYRKVYGAIPGKAEKEFVFLLLERYELEELKVVLRIWHKKIPVDLGEYIIEGNICRQIDFKKIIQAGAIEEVILLLDETPYLKPLLKIKDKFKESNSLFYLEAALDVDYYTRLNKQVGLFSGLDQKAARKILGVLVDTENINWLIRLRKYYSLGIGEMLEFVLPGGRRINKDTVRNFYTTDGLAKIVESVSFGPYAKIKDLVEENVALIENFLYEFLSREVKVALSGFPFTIGTVLGYLILKHRETRNIVSLLNAKYYGWKRQETEPLLSL